MITDNQTVFKCSLISFSIIVAVYFILFSVVISVSIFLIFNEVYIPILFIWILPVLLIFDSFPRLISVSKCIFQNKPALILTPTTLIDNINNYSIHWNEIKQISVQYNRNSEYVAIELYNPKKHIKNTKNAFQKMILKANTKHFNGTFSIHPNILKGKKEELYAQLEKYFNSYKIDNEEND
jgi:hypothetical protein